MAPLYPSVLDAGSAVKISVIVPSFKRSDGLRNALLSLVQQDLDPSEYEVIVVDSSPDDENRRVVEDIGATARCSVRCFVKEPEGPGPSRNLGARNARGEFLAFMDSDCEAAPGWLRSGLAAFASDVGLAQGRTLPERGRVPGVFTWYVRVEEENFFYECANMFYRRSAFDEAGGFSTDYNTTALFVMGGEDVDLAWSVKRNGWSSRFVSDAVVFHEIQPITVGRWLFMKRLFVWPRLARKFPDLRKAFYGRYFYDRSQAYFSLALGGILLASRWPWAVVLAVPYVVLRTFEPSQTLRGLKRPVRLGAYLLRDLSSFAILAAGSVRHRSILL